MNPRPDRTAVFAAAFAALYASHQVADHWGQRHSDALTKGDPGWPGRRACAIHTATQLATQAAALALARTVTGAPITRRGALQALTVTAVTHYWIDRRTTLARLADRLGKSAFYQLGRPRDGHDDNPTLGTGAYALDQSAHISALFLSALIAAARSPR